MSGENKRGDNGARAAPAGEGGEVWKSLKKSRFKSRDRWYENRSTEMRRDVYSLARC